MFYKAFQFTLSKQLTQAKGLTDENLLTGYSSKLFFDGTLQKKERAFSSIQIMPLSIAQMSRTVKSGELGWILTCFPAKKDSLSIASPLDSEMAVRIFD